MERGPVSWHVHAVTTGRPCHDVSGEVVEGVLRLAVQQQQVAEGLRREGR